jgi:hypothetical protein
MAKTAKDKLDELVKKKLQEGWIKSWMMIEVLAGSGEAAKKALERHMEKMDKEDNAIIYRMDYKELVKVENPIPNVAEAYSYVVELELLASNFDKLFFLVLNYGPSSVEIFEPEKISLDMGEAQGILNAVADMLHNFAARTMGGVHIREE